MANYFITYSYLYHQKDMLEDHVRTGAYFNACMRNKAQFKDRVVLDVGTGSGILAIFAAKAGAKKVYAVEATSMAQQARKLVDAQGLSKVVEVIQGTIESVTLPEKVDIIISEWMGYFLLRESMLDSVLVARDKFLKPDGALYPSHARMFLAPIRSQLTQNRFQECSNSAENWHDFVADMKEYYDVNLNCLTESFIEEQQEYFVKTATWADVHPNQLLGPPVCFASFDLLTVTQDEMKKALEANYSMHLPQMCTVEGLAGFFDVEFKGSPANPATDCVLLSTAPSATGATHWGQLIFSLQPGIPCPLNSTIEGRIDITRRGDNHRLLDVTLSEQALRMGESNRKDLAKYLFHIE